MDCKKVKKELSSYLDNEISLNKKLKMEEHLKKCVACARRLKELKRIHTLMQGIPSQEPEPGFYERLSLRLGEKRVSLKERLFGWRHNWQLSLSPAGKMAVAVSVLLVLSFSLFYIWRSFSLPEINIEVFQQEYVHSNEMSSFAEELVLPIMLEIK